MYGESHCCCCYPRPRSILLPLPLSAPVADDRFLTDFLRPGTNDPMPGLIGQEYEAMGGTVYYVGKPHSLVYEACFKALEVTIAYDLKSTRILPDVTLPTTTLSVGSIGSIGRADSPVRYHHLVIPPSRRES